MPALRDRVKVTTAGTGTDNFVMGPAVPGYRTWLAAFANDAAGVSYLIEDGTAWETGSGYYSVAGNSLLRQVIYASSNGGTKISLSGNATVSVAYLSADNIGDWPYFEIANNGGSGDNFSGYFPTVTFGAATPNRDTHNGWNASTVGAYTIPQTGVYDVLFKFRLPDDTVANGSYGLGVDTTNGDNAFFSWFETGAARRKGAIYSSVRAWNAGDIVRAFVYCDNNTGVNGYTAASMTILRIR